MPRIGRAFKELKVGDKLSERITVTEAHVVKAAGLFNDYNALHTNELVALSGEVRNMEEKILATLEAKILVGNETIF